MTTKEIIDYCLSKPCAYVAFPFGEIPLCLKVEKKLFAQMYPNEDDYKITLNCDKITGEFYRNLYPETVVRGYHCPPIQQPYFNTVYLKGIVSDDELKKMIDHSYATVVGKFPRRLQKELLNKRCEARLNILLTREHTFVYNEVDDELPNNGGEET